MQPLTNFPSPLMVLLRPVLALIWVAYGFGDASAEGFDVKSQPIDQLRRIRIEFWYNESYEKKSNKNDLHNLCNNVKK